MESKLRSGTSLVVDRYSYSGVAFSAAKGLDIEWCKVIFNLAHLSTYICLIMVVRQDHILLQAPEVGLIAPDQVIFLGISPEVPHSIPISLIDQPLLEELV